MFSLQVQEALEAPNDPGEAEQTKGEFDSYPEGWREQESDSSQEPRNDRDGFSTLFGEERLYQRVHLENGPEEIDCKVQGGVRNEHCREQEIQHINTLNTEEKELNSRHINTHCLELTKITQESRSFPSNGLNTAELSTQPDRGTGELNTQHINTFDAKHSNVSTAEELKTQDTEIIDPTGKACVDTNSEDRAGLQTAEEKVENIAKENRKGNSESHNEGQSSSTKHCRETYLKVRPCSQRTDLFSLNDSGKHSLETAGICNAGRDKNIHSTINTPLDRLHNTDNRHTCKPEVCPSDSREVEIRDTGVQSSSRDSDRDHKDCNNLDAHCPETLIDTECTTCSQQSHNIKSCCVNIKHKAPPSQDDVRNGKKTFYEANKLDSLSRRELKQINCGEHSLHASAANESTDISGDEGKALNAGVHCNDPLFVYTTCRDCNVAEIEPSKTEEYYLTHLSACDGDTKPYDTLGVSGICSLNLVTESVNSSGPGLCHPLIGKWLPGCSKETAAAESLLHTGEEKRLQKSPHEQQQDLDSRFLQYSTDYKDLNSPDTATENKSILSYTGFTQFVTREDKRNRSKQNVWKDSSSPLALSPLSTSEEKLAKGITLPQLHNEYKDINSCSKGLLISSRHSCDRSHYSLSTEEKGKHQSQELTGSKEVEGSLYPKHGESIEDELHSPFHSAKSNYSEITKENCVSSKPVETPIFTVCRPTHAHEHSVNALNNHTRFVDLKHKRSISSVQGNVTSTIKSTEDSKASFVEKDKPQSDPIEPCWDITVYNNTALETSSVVKEAVGVCNPWLEPFSDGLESDSEDSDQTSSVTQTFHQNKGTLPQGPVNLDGPKKRSDILFPVDWSSEDSAVSGLGEDLESIYCDFYPPQVENLERGTQKEYLEKDTCLRPECNIVNTGNKLHNDQKCHIGSHLTLSVPNELGLFIHLGQCKDINDTHIHSSLCGCIQETDLGTFISQPHQPCIKILKSSAGGLETEIPLKQNKRKELSSSTQLKSHNSIKSCEEKKDSSLSLSEVKAIRYTQSEVLLSSRSLEPILETDCSLDNISNHAVTFLGDKKTETEKLGLKKMKPSEPDQDILGVTSCEHRLSMCKGNS